MGGGLSLYAPLTVTQLEQCASVGKAQNTQVALLLRHVGLK